jgi:hypothetical protein
MPRGKRSRKSERSTAAPVVAAGIVAAVASANLTPAAAQKRPGPQGALISPSPRRSNAKGKGPASKAPHPARPGSTVQRHRKELLDQI